MIWYEGCGLSYDDAYFMNYGEYPKPNYDKKNTDIEYDEHYNEDADEAYREYQQANYDEYFTNSYIYCLYK